MHAYFLNAIRYPNNSQYEEFKNIHTFLFDKSGTIYDDQNQAQHEQIAATYVNDLAGILYQYALSIGVSSSPRASISLAQYCKDLAWAGLHGTRAYKNAPDKSRIEGNINRKATSASNSSMIKYCL